MRHTSLNRELQLMLQLTENRSYTVEQLCERLEISRRNFYYYINFFRETGFIIEKHGPYHSIDKESPWFKKLFKVFHLTEDEALEIRHMLDGANANNLQVKHLKDKLDRLYDFHIMDEVKMDKLVTDRLSALYDAIKLKQKVMLINYSSPHSNTTSNRLVEPYMFLNGNNEVRCYELLSKTNKTFKISRMEAVMPIMEDWENEHLHRRMHTDIFMFSGEKKLPVRLRLDRLAHNLLVEEYPAATPFLTAEDKEHWIFELDVCSYAGIGRFTLGLFEHIDILGDEDFREYIKGKIKEMQEKISLSSRMPSER